MRASLDASTVTPGSTAPDVSLTTPVIALCACTSAGNASRDTPITNPRTTVRIIRPSLSEIDRYRRWKNVPKRD